MTSSKNTRMNLKITDYDAYVFDLYGTLVDILTDEEDESLWSFFANHLHAHGIVIPDDELKSVYRFLCANEQAKADNALAEAHIPGPAEIDVIQVWRQIGEQAGVNLSDAELSELSWTFRRLSTKKLRLYDGAESLLNNLRKNGKKVVLLTNAQASFTLPELTVLGLDHAFDQLLISSAAGVKKPSTVFFARLWDLGLIPQRSLMIGNDDVCDCWGAANVGMDSVYIRTDQSPPLSGPLPQNCM